MRFINYRVEPGQAYPNGDVQFFATSAAQIMPALRDIRDRLNVRQETPEWLKKHTRIDLDRVVPQELETITYANPGSYP